MFIFGRPFVKRFTLCYQTILCLSVLSLLSVCLSVCLSICLSVTMVYCGQMVGWIKMKLGMEIGLGPGYIVLDGTQSPQKGHSPQFSVHVCCGQVAGCIKMPLGMEVGLGPGDTVR